MLCLRRALRLVRTELSPAWAGSADLKRTVHRSARNSAATTPGCLLRAFRNVLTIVALLKPPARNSSRNAPASFAPAIHENQFAAPDCRSSGKVDASTNSAP